VNAQVPTADLQTQTLPFLEVTRSARGWLPIRRRKCPRAHELVEAGAGQVNHPGHIADGHDRLGHVVVSHCTALRHESDRIFTTGSPVFAPSSSQLPPPAVVLGD